MMRDDTEPDGGSNPGEASNPDGGSNPGDVESSASEGATIDPGVLDLDHVFEVLDHPRRRYLLYALATDDEWSLSELATKLAAWEGEVDERAVHEDVRDRAYVSLWHAHVPKLVEHGVVEFDEETERLRRGDHATQVFAALGGAGASLDSRQEQHAGREYEDGDE
jgi:hypothetical protein